MILHDLELPLGTTQNLLIHHQWELQVNGMHLDSLAWLSKLDCNQVLICWPSHSSHSLPAAWNIAIYQLIFIERLNKSFKQSLLFKVDWCLHYLPKHFFVLLSIAPKLCSSDPWKGLLPLLHLSSCDPSLWDPPFLTSLSGSPLPSG